MNKIKIAIFTIIIIISIIGIKKLIYVNQVGGQDEIVFDGSSFLCDQKKVISKFKYCVEESREYTFNINTKTFDIEEEAPLSSDKQDIV